MLAKNIVIIILSLVVGVTGRGYEMNFKISEEQREGTMLIDLKSTYLKLASQTVRRPNPSILSFQFSASSNEMKKYFNLDKITGVLYNKEIFDREKFCSTSFPILTSSCEFQFNVVVLPKENMEILKITLQLQDINDNEPIFSPSFVSLSISDDSKIGTTVALPTAYDADLDPFAVSHYTIDNSMSDQIFSFSFDLTSLKMKDDSMDLKLILKKSLKNLQTNTNKLRGVIKAFDKGYPPLYGFLFVNLTIIKSSKNTPQFDQKFYNVFIEENSPINADVLQIHVEMSDNSSIQFRLQHTNFEKFPFKIGIKSGLITVDGSLDYETEAKYKFDVFATTYTHHHASSSAKVEVNIIDLNDVVPTMKLNTLTGNNKKAEIKENSPVGTFVSYLHVSDVEAGNNGKVTCFTVSDFFTLNSTANEEYILQSRKIFDRENIDRYDLSIVCKDFGNPSLSAHVDLEIEILDVNDNDPVFDKNIYEIELTGNDHVGKNLIKVHASDLDTGQNAAITYHLKPLNVSSSYVNSSSATRKDNVLHIDELDGSIYLQNVFFFEKDIKELSFVISALDSGITKRTGTALIKLKIQTLNENFPKFHSNKYIFNITPESVIYGAVFGKVTASSINRLAANESITYHSQNRFVNVSPSNGDLSWKNINLNNNSSINFTVTASNIHFSKSLQTTIPVVINLLRDNNLAYKELTATYIGNAKPGSVIYKFKKEEGESSFNIVSGNEKKLFLLNHSTGDLIVADRFKPGLTYHNISVLFIKKLPFPKNKNDKKSLDGKNIENVFLERSDSMSGKVKNRGSISQANIKSDKQNERWSFHRRLLILTLVVNNTSNYAQPFDSWTQNSDNILTVSFAVFGFFFFLILSIIIFCVFRKCNKEKKKRSKGFNLKQEKFKITSNAFDGDSKLLPDLYETSILNKSVLINKSESDRRKEVKFSLVQMEDRDEKKHANSQYFSLYKVRIFA